MLKFIYRYHSFKKDLYNKKPAWFHILSLGMLAFWVFALKTSVLDANNIPTGSMIPTLKIGDFLFVNKMRYSFHIPFTNVHLFHFDKPKRGDIVTFTPPVPDKNLEGKTLVKRVIAVEGDFVEVYDNEIIINGVPYGVKSETDRSTLEDLDYPKVEYSSTDDLELFKEDVTDPHSKKVVRTHYMMKNKYRSDLADPKITWTIPKNKYMVMGDNRDDSDDSRRWGLVDINDIHGKVYMIYFSINWGSRFDTLVRVVNPFSYLGRWITGSAKHVEVRWNRVGERVY